MSKQASHRLARVVAVLAVVAASGTASASAGAPALAHHPDAVVKGSGRGVLTDPDGKSFRLQSFHVRGRVTGGGSARGWIYFRWHGSFPEVWGDPVCESTCDTVVLVGQVTGGSVAPDGTVTLSGTARELDLRRGRVVFDSGLDEPFSIVAGPSQGRNRFALQWCLLPAFQIDGPIRVHAGGRGHGYGSSYSSTARSSCRS
jgi:hypothetical protein